MIYRVKILMNPIIEISGELCSVSCLYKNWNMDGFCRLFLEDLEPANYSYGNTKYKRCNQCLESEILQKTLIGGN